MYWVWRGNDQVDNQTRCSRLDVKTLNDDQIAEEINQIDKLIGNLLKESTESSDAKFLEISLDKFRLANYFPVLESKDASRIRALRLYVRNCSKFDSLEALKKLENLEEISITGGVLTKQFVAILTRKYLEQSETKQRTPSLAD